MMCRHRKVEYRSKHEEEMTTDVSVSEKELGIGGLDRNMYKGRKENNNVVKGWGLEDEESEKYGNTDMSDM
jgi:hypothetical protein